MTNSNWQLEGRWAEFCSCTAGCPCETMAPPSAGTCDGAVVMDIEKGHFGDVNLDGVTVVATFFFPRAIHHGGGHMHPIFPASTTEQQREALFAILSGEGQPVGTAFNIFSVIVEHHHDPVYTDIKFEWDIEKRRCLLDIPGVVRAETAPLRNPVTDEEVQVRTVLPSGWCFYEGEVGEGTAKSISDIKFDWSKRHSSLAYFAFDNNGMAYSYQEAKERWNLDKSA